MKRPAQAPPEPPRCAYAATEETSVQPNSADEVPELKQRIQQLEQANAKLQEERRNWMDIVQGVRKVLDETKKQVEQPPQVFISSKMAQIDGLSVAEQYYLDLCSVCANLDRLFVYYLYPPEPAPPRRQSIVVAPKAQAAPTTAPKAEVSTSPPPAPSTPKKEQLAETSEDLLNCPLCLDDLPYERFHALTCGHLYCLECLRAYFQDCITPKKEQLAETSEDLLNCPLCLDDLPYERFHALTCGHLYCLECLRAYFQDCITSKKLPIICPDPSCKKEVEFGDVSRVCPKDVVEKMHTFLLDVAVEKHPEVFSCCPTPDCGYVFVWEPGDPVDFTCPKCTRRYCLKCKVPFHEGVSCETYRLKNKDHDEELFTEFAQGFKFKQCTKCNRWVELGAGCNHIKCPCGHEFCYACGKDFPCACGQDPHAPGFRPRNLSSAIYAPYAAFVAIRNPLLRRVGLEQYTYTPQQLKQIHQQQQERRLQVQQQYQQLQLQQAQQALQTQLQQRQMQQQVHSQAPMWCNSCPNPAIHSTSHWKMSHC
eukprot:TRINITY_DN1870_c0_g1_i2.p1 TRINITY_DN1870_c0_g1~~TRINITY_DN1870_c0_g1_i2.p1  ORF type:complete len:550 (+),score=104.60 TRINITY_DN1870_c0_g1_i2:41-1651(+)